LEAPPPTYYIAPSQAFSLGRPKSPQNDLLGFEDFDDDELNILETFLSSNPVFPEETLAANDDANLFAPSSSSDDEWDANDRSPYPTPKVTACPLTAPVDTFNLEGASESARVLFTELYNNDQFRSAESFREQSKQSKEILKILGAMQQTLLPPIVISSFRQSGIVFTFSQEHKCLVCKVGPSQTRRVRGLKPAPKNDAVACIGGAHGTRIRVQ
jgi:hypothetical protein